MPRTLALGNRFVFHEVAYQVMDFLDWYEARGAPNHADWTDYREQIVAMKENDLFQRCDHDWFCDGIEAYFLAMRTNDPGVEARLVFRGNVLLAAYEQWRLEPIIEIALDPLAKHLVTFEHTNTSTRNRARPCGGSFALG